MKNAFYILITLVLSVISFSCNNKQNSVVLPEIIFAHERFHKDTTLSFNGIKVSEIATRKQLDSAFSAPVTLVTKSGKEFKFSCPKADTNGDTVVVIYFQNDVFCYYDELDELRHLFEEKYNTYSYFTIHSTVLGIDEYRILGDTIDHTLVTRNSIEEYIRQEVIPNFDRSKGIMEYVWEWNNCRIEVGISFGKLCVQYWNVGYQDRTANKKKQIEIKKVQQMEEEQRIDSIRKTQQF